MKRTILAFFIAVWLFAFLIPIAKAQSKQSGDVTPSRSFSKMSPAVREEVERLLSDDPGKRATAAASLGEMGPLASPAIPWLVAAIRDIRRILSLDSGEVPVAFVVGQALSKIEPAARTYVAAQLANPNTSADMRGDAALASAAIKYPNSLDNLLSSLPIVYGESDPDGEYGRVLRQALNCFLPEARAKKDWRILDALIRLAETAGAAGPRGRGDSDVSRIEFGNIFHQSFSTVKQMSDWWSQNKGNQLPDLSLINCRVRK